MAKDAGNKSKEVYNYRYGRSLNVQICVMGSASSWLGGWQVLKPFEAGRHNPRSRFEGTLNCRRVKSAGPGTGRSRQASSSEGSPRHPLHSSLDDWLSPIQESFMSRVEAAGRIKANNSTSTLGDTESETSSHGAVDGLSPPLEHPSALPPDDEKALDGEGSIVHVHASIPRGIHVMEDEVKAGELDLR